MEPPAYNQSFPEICAKTVYLPLAQLFKLQHTMQDIRSFLRSPQDTSNPRFVRYLSASIFNKSEFDVEVSAVNASLGKQVSIESGVDTVRNGITCNSVVHLDELAFQNLFENMYDIVHHTRQLQKTHSILNGHIIAVISDVLAVMLMKYLDIGFIFEGNEMEFMTAFFKVYNEMMIFKMGVPMMKRINKICKDFSLKLGFVDTFSVFNDTCLQMNAIMNATKDKFLDKNVYSEAADWATG
jgi:hypothetical protein